VTSPLHQAVGAYYARKRRKIVTALEQTGDFNRVIELGPVVGVLLHIFGHKISKCSAVCFPFPQCVG